MKGKVNSRSSLLLLIDSSSPDERERERLTIKIRWERKILQPKKEEQEKGKEMQKKDDDLALVGQLCDLSPSREEGGNE